MPLALVLLCFVKKDTVIGIIGNTQGVNKAAKPLKNAIKNNIQRLSDTSAELFFSIILAVLANFLFPEILKEKSTASGGKHCDLSQVIK